MSETPKLSSVKLEGHEPSILYRCLRNFQMLQGRGDDDTLAVNLEELAQALIAKRTLKGGLRVAALTVMDATITGETDLITARRYDDLYNKIDNALEIEIKE
jgi:hypothetical protein